MEDHAADQLDVEVALAERALARLTAERERLREQVVERFPVLAGTLAQLVGVRLELGVVEQLHLGLEAVDDVDALLEVLELPALAEREARGR